MHYYNAKVKVGGSLHSEVRKFEISAPELIFLRALHGEDNVVDIEDLGERKARARPGEQQRDSDAALRSLIAEEYRVHKNEARAKIFAETFGRPHVPLPTVAPEIEGTTRGYIPPASKARRVIRAVEPEAEEAMV